MSDRVWVAASLPRNRMGRVRAFTTEELARDWCDAQSDMWKVVPTLLDPPVADLGPPDIGASDGR